MIGNKAGWMNKLAQMAVKDETQDTDEKMLSFSFGTTPEDVIKKRVNIETPKGYSMQIKNQDEWKTISDVVNQGIDSHLEGFTRSKFDHNTGKCIIHPEEMTTFLRRLYEAGDDSSWSLRGDILATLGIEEI
jgi:hypothetical protein